MYAIDCSSGISWCFSRQLSQRRLFPRETADLVIAGNVAGLVVVAALVPLVLITELPTGTERPHISTLSRNAMLKCRKHPLALSMHILY